jgi:hypothetical protein
MTAGGAILQESMQTSFGNRLVVRRYLIIPVTLGLALIVSWPRASFAMAMASSATADPMLWVSVGLLLVMLYLNARLGAEAYSPEAASHVRDFAVHTPVSLASVVAGKLLFGILHTLLLVSFGAPFLVAAVATSGADWRQVGESLAVAASAGLAARLYGFFLLTLTGPHALTRNAITILGILAFLLATFLFAPGLNPLQILIDASRRAPGEAARAILGVSTATFSMGAGLALAGTFAALSLCVLRVVRRRASRERVACD